MKRKLSKFRKSQLCVFTYRLIIFIAAIVLYILFLQGNSFAISQFEVLKGFNFFNFVDNFSVFHILWLLWIFDMCIQIFPLKEKFRNFIKLSKGAQKLHKNHYTPSQKEVNKEVLKEQIKKANKKALLILIIWCSVAFVACVVVVVIRNTFNIQHEMNCLLLILTLFASVFDTVCTLFWCPFRMIQGNRCCLTCRIYNWDHMMMFTPVLTVPSFYTLSLFALGIITMIVWEIKYKLHPERFFEITNESLRCKNCTDKRCQRLGGLLNLKKKEKTNGYN